MLGEGLFHSLHMIKLQELERYDKPSRKKKKKKEIPASPAEFFRTLQDFFKTSSKPEFIYARQRASAL